MWQSAANSWVFDFGVNRAGVTTLWVSADEATRLGKGATFTQQAAEALLCAKPCAIYHYPTVGAKEVLTYTSDPELNSPRGGAEIDFTPYFTQMGFRYIQLNYSGTEPWQPNASTLTMRFINTVRGPCC